MFGRRVDDPEGSEAVHAPSQQENSQCALHYPSPLRQRFPTKRTKTTNRHGRGQTIEGFDLRVRSHLQCHKDHSERDCTGKTK